MDVPGPLAGLGGQLPPHPLWSQCGASLCPGFLCVPYFLGHFTYLAQLGLFKALSSFGHVPLFIHGDEW
jgi:hypothetical protein